MVSQALKMADNVPTLENLRNILLFLFKLKKSAPESYSMLVEAYGDHALTEKICRRWFGRFRSGDFNLSNEERGRPPKKFEDVDLQALLDEDDAQTQEQLAATLQCDRSSISTRLKKMGKIQKGTRWVPHELNDRQKEKRKTTCEILLQRQERTRFLHRIITGDEKWIHFINPDPKKHWVSPGQRVQGTPVRNIHGKKVMLCIWWDQKGVLYYELLKPGETVTGERYRQQMIRLNHALVEKRPEWAQRHGNPILLHDNARPHIEFTVQVTINALDWEVLPHPPYSPDVAPSDYCLFRSMARSLKGIEFANYEEVKNWLDEWIEQKPQDFFMDGIQKLPNNWANVIRNNGNYS